MSEETLADIIAEMRMGNAGDFPFAYVIGDPDTPEVIDFTTKKVVEPRKINIRRVTVSNLADRLEAAVKRERATVGNSAAMREALNIALPALLGWQLGQTTRKEHEVAVAAIKRALAAPARNCDRKFVDHVDMYYAFKDWCHAKGHTIEPLLASDAFDWFLETATEKGEGDAN